LIAKRVFLGISIGNIPSHALLISSSLNLTASSFSPNASIISPIMILTKMRLEEVVSSSLILTQFITVQEIASEESMCPKKRAMLRRRLVSYRWMVV
jgi:hypothetical protein